MARLKRLLEQSSKRDRNRRLSGGNRSREIVGMKAADGTQVREKRQELALYASETSEPGSLWGKQARKKAMYLQPRSERDSVEEDKRKNKAMEMVVTERQNGNEEPQQNTGRNKEVKDLGLEKSSGFKGLTHKADYGCNTRHDHLVLQKNTGCVRERMALVVRATLSKSVGRVRVIRGVVKRLLAACIERRRKRAVYIQSIWV